MNGLAVIALFMAGVAVGISIAVVAFVNLGRKK